MPTEEQYGNQTRMDAVRSADKELRSGPRDPRTHGIRREAIGYVGDPPLPDEEEQLTDVQREALPEADVQALPAGAKTVQSAIGGETPEEAHKTWGKMAGDWSKKYDKAKASGRAAMDATREWNKSMGLPEWSSSEDILSLIAAGKVRIADPQIRQAAAHLMKLNSAAIADEAAQEEATQSAAGDDPYFQGQNIKQEFPERTYHPRDFIRE